MPQFKFLPTVGQRVFAGNGSNDNSSPTAHAMAGSTAATVGQWGSPFDPARGGWDVEQAVTRGLERVIWVARCVDAIATNQAKLNIVKRKGDPKEGEIIPDPQLFNLLNRRPNSYETAQQFRYRLSGQALLSKRGVFVEVVKDAFGIPVELHLLPPQQVEPIPDREKFVSGFRLNMLTGGMIVIPKERVMWIRLKPHPTDPFAQMTPLMAAGLAADTDWLSRLFNRNFLANDGRPGLLVAIKGRMNTTDAKEIKDRFSGGPEKAGRTTVVEAEGVAVSDLAANPRDVQWLEGINGSKNDILLAFGTPESVLGNASGRTFDNADAEKENWWEETMEGHCDAIGSGFDPLTGSITDDEFLGFDYSMVDVLQRKKRARHDKALAEFQAGVLTLDDYYEATGRPRWDVAGTRVLYLTSGLVVGKDEADVQEVAQLPVIGVPAQQAALGGAPGQPAIGGSPYQAITPQMLGQAAQQGALIGTAKGQRHFENIIAARALQITNAPKRARKTEVKEDEVLVGDVIVPHPYEDLRTTYESQFEGVIDGWSAQQETFIPQRLDTTKARKGTRHWEGDGAGTKAINPNYVVDTDRWSTDLKTSMGRLMDRIAKTTIQQTAQTMEQDGFVKAMHAKGLGSPQARSAVLRVYGTTSQQQKAVDDLLGPLNGVVTEAAANQSRRVAEKIQQMDAAGESMTAIKAEVRRMTGARSEWRSQLAKYLTTALVEGAQYKTWLQAGDLVTKHWNTTEDEKVRHSHQDADRQDKPVNRKFKVGSSWLDHPGDPKGAIQETANCRCYSTYSVSEKQQDFFDEHAGGAYE